MYNSLKQRTELFVENRDIIKSNFKWDNSALYPLCSCLYTEQGRVIDAEKIKNSKKIIKNKTGFFSNFRSSTFLVYATMLSLEKDPKYKFDNILKAHKILRKEFWSTQYLPLSAFIIANMAQPSEYNRIVKESKVIYQRMKKEHPFLTSSEDYSFAVLFALSDLTVDKAIDEMERCYQLLKDNFFSKNAVQALSHTLAFGEEEAEAKCNRLKEIFSGLRKRGCKYGSGVELTVLGVLALVANDVEQAVEDIIEVNERLLDNKGFGALGIGRAQRVMYSTIITLQEYEKNLEKNLANVTSINSVTSILIAQQVAISAAIAASVAASASNN